MFRTGDQIGPYTLIQELGRGHFGVVWLAEKRAGLIQPQVALKLPFLVEQDLDSIRREAVIWKQASGHANVMPVLDADVFDGQVAIISEFAADGSLRAWLRRHGGKAPTFAKATDLTLGILAGLDHLHTRKVIHRDLKPENVLLQGETPRITDFGIARVLRSTHETQATQGIGGTPAYMAPEAWKGKRSERTDLWAVGVMYFEMLVGRRPFPQSDQPSLMRAILDEEPATLPLDTPATAIRVIRRSLQKKPTQRYQTAAEMLADLRHSSPPPRVTEIIVPEVHAMPSLTTLDPAFQRLRTTKTVQDSKRGRNKQELLDEILGKAKAKLLTAGYSFTQIKASGTEIKLDGFRLAWNVTKLQQQWYFRIHYVTEIDDLSLADKLADWHPSWHPTSVDEIEVQITDRFDVLRASKKARDNSLAIELILDNRIRVSGKNWPNLTSVNGLCLDLMVADTGSKVATKNLPYGSCKEWSVCINLLIELSRWIGT